MTDYTYLWWDIRPHPRLGTVEVRAMDAQSRLGTIAGLAALVHALAAACADGHGYVESAEALTESRSVPARDGLDATIWWCGGLYPVRDVARDVLALARPYARLGGSTRSRRSSASLREATRRPHARRARGRRDAAVLERLVAEAAEPLYGYTSTTSPIRTQL